MKKQTIINSIIVSGLLFASVASASNQNSDTDLIYGNSSVVPSQSEPFVAGSTTQDNQLNDLIYGEQESVPTRGESHERFVDNRDSNTDLIYGI